MRILDESKTNELNYEELDLDKGYLISDNVTVHIEASPAIEEVGHWQVVAVLPNGHEDKVWIVDSPAVPAVEEHDEDETVYIYVQYSEAELERRRVQREIEDKKARLNALTEDLIQSLMGEVVPNLEERKAEFIELHAQVRVLEGKEAREIAQK